MSKLMYFYSSLTHTVSYCSTLGLEILKNCRFQFNDSRDTAEKALSIINQKRMEVNVSSHELTKTDLEDIDNLAKTFGSDADIKRSFQKTLLAKKRNELSDNLNDLANLVSNIAAVNTYVSHVEMSKALFALYAFDFLLSVFHRENN